MNDDSDDGTPSRLDAAGLAQLARQAAAREPCAACAALGAAGWESLAAGTDVTRLERVATLRAPADVEPTLAEHHRAGTHYWSSDAPIAPAHHPYNRCDVWRCRDCGRAWLRYTEYGGYYVDERIRALDAAHVVDA